MTLTQCTKTCKEHGERCIYATGFVFFAEHKQHTHPIGKGWEGGFCIWRDGEKAIISKELPN